MVPRNQQNYIKVRSDTKIAADPSAGRGIRTPAGQRPTGSRGQRNSALPPRLQTDYMGQETLKRFYQEIDLHVPCR